MTPLDLEYQLPPWQAICVRIDSAYATRLMSNRLGLVSGNSRIDRGHEGL